MTNQRIASVSRGMFQFSRTIKWVWQFSVCNGIQKASCPLDPPSYMGQKPVKFISCAFERDNHDRYSRQRYRQNPQNTHRWVQSVSYYSIAAAEAAGLGDFSKLPAALKVVLENLLRFEDGGFSVSVDDIKAFSEWATNGGQNPREIAYRPARVLMQDFTGVPAVVDLGRDARWHRGLGGDAEQINPLNPVDLVIDHSVMIDEFGNPRAFQMNVDREYERNMERYTFLKWGQERV